MYHEPEGGLRSEEGGKKFLGPVEAILVTWERDAPLGLMVVSMAARLFKELMGQDVQLPLSGSAIKDAATR